MKRAESMREATGEIVRDLSPQRVVPTELATAKNVVLLELIEIGSYLVQRREGAIHVRGYVIAHARPCLPVARAFDELVDGELAVRKRRMGMAVDGQPRAAWFSHSLISVSCPQAELAWCRGGGASCHAAASAEIPRNHAGVWSLHRWDAPAAAREPRPERRRDSRRDSSAARLDSRGYRCPAMVSPLRSYLAPARWRMSASARCRG